MIGVYLSYPFCAQKCTFCNFASGVLPHALEAQYADALLREIEAAHFPEQPDTVYWGGGTPSGMDLHAFARVLGALRGKPWREATLEAAPGTITPERIEHWLGAGINRISLGVQSFVTQELARTGRKHTAATVFRDVEMLRAQGLSNINIDLIAGLPGQTAASWNASLYALARLDPPHVSVYMLEVDEDSRLGNEILRGGTRYNAADVPSDDLTAALYETAVARLESIGILRYEISNFARPGWESVHNLKYWRRENYLGFGADAHSSVNGRRWQNVERAEDYIRLSPHARIAETEAHETEEKFFVGLRMTEGIQTESADWERHGPTIERFVAHQLMERDGDRLRLTPRGVMLSNEVLQEFLQL